MSDYMRQLHDACLYVVIEITCNLFPQHFYLPLQSTDLKLSAGGNRPVPAGVLQRLNRFCGL